MLDSKNIYTRKDYGVKSVIEKRNEIDARRWTAFYFLREAYMRGSSFSCFHERHQRRKGRSVFKDKIKKWKSKMNERRNKRFEDDIIPF